MEPVYAQSDESSDSAGLLVSAVARCGTVLHDSFWCCVTPLDRFLCLVWFVEEAAFKTVCLKLLSVLFRQQL